LTRAADIAVLRVLAAIGHRMAEQAAQRLAEARVIAEALAGLDRAAAPSRIALSSRTHAVLRDSGLTANVRVNPDIATWQQAAAALRADPQAEVSIPIPPAVVPPLPQPMAYPSVTVMVPLTAEELAQREQEKAT
jgi:hypothetical protein